MFGKLTFMVMASVFSIVFIVVGIPILLPAVNSARGTSTPQQITCNPLNENNCTLQLSGQHANTTKDGIEIVDVATNQSVIDNVSYDNSNNTLNVTQLTPNTPYTFNVTYLLLNSNMSGPVNLLLQRLPLIMVLALSVIIFLSARSYIRT